MHQDIYSLLSFIYLCGIQYFPPHEHASFRIFLLYNYCNSLNLFYLVYFVKALLGYNP
jgi:hypothetical protein